jgi:hypothetical protein
MSLFPTKESQLGSTDRQRLFRHDEWRPSRSLRCYGPGARGPGPKLEQTGRRRLDAFEAHRAIVERIASEKFDNSKWEWDGITVLVKDIDIRRG